MLSAIGQESTTAVLAPFFVGTLGAGPLALAGVEVAGRAGGAAARIGGTNAEARRPGAWGYLSFVGHSGIAIASGFLSASGAVWQAGACRAGSLAVGGLRPPLLLGQTDEITSRQRTGRRVGVERCIGAASAAAGPLTALVLLLFFEVRTVILLAVVPAVAALAIVTFGGARARPAGPTAVQLPPVRARITLIRRGPLAGLLLGVALYEGANIAAVLLLLRAAKILPDGFGPFTQFQSVAFLYVVYQLTAAFAAAWAGALADRVGAGTVIGNGAVLLLVAYAGFAFANSGDVALMIGCFVLAGVASGAVDAAKYVGVWRLSPPETRWTAFVTLAGLQSVGRALATLTAGGLWALVAPEAGLLVCGPLLLAAAVFLTVRGIQARRTTTTTATP